MASADYEHLPSAHDVTAAILETLSDVDALKLQKLLFYAQGWYVAWYGEPLFREPIEGWRDGPTVRVVWDTYKDYEYRPIPKARGGNPRALSPQREAALEAIATAYDKLSSDALRQRSHHERPWEEAWAKRKHANWGSEEIPIQDLRAYFTGHATFPRRGGPSAELDDETAQAILRGDREALRRAVEREAASKE